MNTYIQVTQEGKGETASLFDDFMAKSVWVKQKTRSNERVLTLLNQRL